MTKMRYSRDVDVLLVELSDDSIDHAEESGRFIVHFSKKGDPVLLEIFDAKQFVLSSVSTLVNETEATLP